MKSVIRIAVLAAYIGNPLLYAAHLSAEAGRPVCAVCVAEANAVAGPALKCAGGCGDASHHHHAPAHRHGDCAICKASSADATTVVCAGSTSEAGALPASVRSDPAPRAVAPAVANRPRSPPFA